MVSLLINRLTRYMGKHKYEAVRMMAGSVGIFDTIYQFVSYV
jgi:hypothetical protein